MIKVQYVSGTPCVYQVSEGDRLLGEIKLVNERMKFAQLDEVCITEKQDSEIKRIVSLMKS